MKKINTKSKLIIKDKKLIKEMEYASGLTDPKEAGKLIKTAVFGVYQAWRRVWRTGVVLPFRLGVAMFVTGEKLSTVMSEWEDKDKEIKKEQLAIIQQTGVSETVDAMIGFCNPGALAFQKFVEWENKDLKNAWKSGSKEFWNNTAGAWNKNLRVGEDEKDKEDLAIMLYANFIVFCCNKILNENIDQKTMTSVPRDKKLKSAVSPSNKVSKNSVQYKKLLKLFTKEIFIEHEEIAKAELGSLEKFNILKKFFLNISQNTVSVERASQDLLANNIYDALNDFISRISIVETAVLKKLFKEFSKSPGTVSKPESKPDDSEPEGEKQTTSDVAYESFRQNNKKQLFINKNNIILKSNLLEDKNTLNEDAKFNFFAMMSNKKKKEIAEEIQAQAAKAHVLLKEEHGFLSSMCILCGVYLAMFKFAAIYKTWESFVKQIMGGQFENMQSNINVDDLKKEFDDAKNTYNKSFVQLKKIIAENGKSESSIPIEEIASFEKEIGTNFIDGELTKSIEKLIETFNYENEVLKEILIKDMKINETLNLSENEFISLFEKVLNDQNVSEGALNINRMRNTIGVILFLEAMLSKEKDNFLGGLETNRKSVLNRFINSRKMCNSIKNHMSSDIGNLYFSRLEKSKDQGAMEAANSSKSFIEKAVSYKASDFIDSISYLENLPIEETVKQKKEIIINGFTNYMKSFNIGDAESVTSKDKEVEGSIAIDSKFSKSALITTQKEENK